MPEFWRWYLKESCVHISNKPRIEHGHLARATRELAKGNSVRSPIALDGNRVNRCKHFYYGVPEYGCLKEANTLTNSPHLAPHPLSRGTGPEK